MRNATSSKLSAKRLCKTTRNGIVTLVTLLFVGGCSYDNSGTSMQGPVCDEAFSSIQGFASSDLSLCDDLIAYGPQELLNRVLGTWQGSYPGSTSYDSFDFTVSITTKEDEQPSDEAVRCELISRCSSGFGVRSCG